MKPQLVSTPNRAAWMILGLLLLILPAQSSAQVQGPPAGRTPDVINPRAEDRARQLSEGRLRSAEMDAAAESENQKRVRAAIAHMREDFARIQVLRNDIARDLVARKPLNYKLVAEQTGEINKRANGLNVYMMARASEDKEPEDSPEIPTDEMVGSLVKLCKLIDRFTENPALKNASTIDVKDIDKAKENKVQADQDLLTIIKLSESIRKKADSLNSSQ